MVVVAAAASRITESDGGDRCRSGRRSHRCHCCHWGSWWLPPLVMVVVAGGSGDRRHCCRRRYPEWGVVFAIIENAGGPPQDGAGSDVVAEAVDVVSGRTCHDHDGGALSLKIREKIVL